MRHRITIQAENPTTDAGGGQTDPWASPTTVATVNACIEPMSGRELINASLDSLREAYDESDDARELVSRAEQRIFAILDDRGSTERVFRYRLDGTLEGSWEFDTDENTQPRGIAVDATSASDVWIVDRSTDEVTRFSNAAGITSGTAIADDRFALQDHRRLTGQ